METAGALIKRINASDVDVFNKASLRAVGRGESPALNSYMENNQAGLIIVILIIFNLTQTGAVTWKINAHL